MANKGLFASAITKLLPAADTVNRELAPAYEYGPQEKLAQLAATGTLADNFYTSAETQLSEVAICCDIDKHVYYAGHTDPKVVNALRASHWFDLREWAARSPGDAAA